jgi:hypothetical protein
MTNTLHRYGDADSFRDDFILFCLASTGNNDQGAAAKQRQFLTICAKHGPVNMGNGNRATFKPERHLNPLAHWNRPAIPDWQGVIDECVKPGTTAAVFDTRQKAEAALKEVVDADLGLSVNMSTSVEGAKSCAEGCGIERHSVEYSLGFQDPHDHLPNSQVVQLATMCGHGMVSFNMARKMIDMVREGRRTPKQAVTTLARFCPCGVYNPARAQRVLEEARDHSG